jgi:DNA polymerase III subunit delta'
VTRILTVEYNRPMAFADFPKPAPSVELLQRSLLRGRLAHAYLFSGDSTDALEPVARTLAKTLNCDASPDQVSTRAEADSCDRCSACRRIDTFNHPDVLWIRPESKLRIITIGQIREVMHTINLKPTEARWKVTVIVGADRLNTQAANAFLKTLEEPPPRSILLLLSTEPQRLIETIRSRCLRLHFADATSQPVKFDDEPWLTGFAAAAARPQPSLIGRYQLLGEFLKRLAHIRQSVETLVTERSPLESHSDIDPDLREKWENELNASVEAEYRRQRADLLGALHCWLRDVWISTHTPQHHLLSLPGLQPHSASLAARLSPRTALENLQTWEQTRRILDTNVQEALALEVGFLKLTL